MATTTTSFSQELQALLELDRWNGVVGLYFLDAMAKGGYATLLQNAVPGIGLTQEVTGKVDTTSYAVFGDMSYDVTEQLTVSAGLRWTRDEKDGVVFKGNFLGLGSPLTGADVLPIQVLTDYERSKNFSELTPRASVSYRFNPDLTVYFAYGRGFKSGGFDMRGDAAAYPGRPAALLRGQRRR